MFLARSCKYCRKSSKVRSCIVISSHASSSLSLGISLFYVLGLSYGRRLLMRDYHCWRDVEIWRRKSSLLKFHFISWFVSLFNFSSSPLRLSILFQDAFHEGNSVRIVISSIWVFLTNYSQPRYPPSNPSSPHSSHHPFGSYSLVS